MPERLDTIREVIGVDRVVHDPVRYALLAYLQVVETADFTFLARELELTRGNLSFHLGKLDEAGYVQVDKSFVRKRPRTLYRITAVGKEAFREYRNCMVRALNVSDQTSEKSDE